MKRLTIITAMMLAAPAFADPVSQQPAHPEQSMTGQAQPTVEQVQEQANGIISALRQQRDNANDQLAQAMAVNAKLTKDLEAAKKAAEPKKDEPHAP